MKRVISLVMLAALAAAGAAAQEQPKYQSVAPKKKKPKPLDPADVATLTGRPVSPSVAALPKPKDRSEAVDNGEEAPNKRPPLNQEDVDILTGKHDQYDSARYRYRGNWEALWWLDWMERGGYAGNERDSLLFPGTTGHRGRPFILPRHRSGRHLLLPGHFRGGSLFFLFRH